MTPRAVCSGFGGRLFGLALLAAGCGPERFNMPSGDGGGGGETIDATNGGAGGAILGGAGGAILGGAGGASLGGSGGAILGGSGGNGSGGDTNGSGGASGSGGAGGSAVDGASGSGGQAGRPGGSGGTGGVDAGMGATGGSGSGGANGSGGASGSGGAGGYPSPDSGGGGSTDAAVVTGACAGKVRTPAAGATLLADLESGDLTDWYEYRDPTPGATMNPVEIVMPGASGTARGVHLSGQGFQSYGGGMGLRLLCTNASAFQGITFWARGTSGTDNWISLQVAVPQTQAAADGGDCTARCYDHPLKRVQLGPNWQQYHVAFTDLAQSGFGDPATYQGLIMALNWASLSGPNLDYSVDEVAFY